MDRFFEATNKTDEITFSTDGPINTNYSKTGDGICLVIICESPSYDEIAKGFPAVSSTGARIYYQLVREGIIENRGRYKTETHYELFALNGIYLTNLVRYQADKNIKGKRGEKDKRVKQLWTKTKSDIFQEIEKLATKSKEIPILIA